MKAKYLPNNILCIFIIINKLGLCTWKYISVFCFLIFSMIIFGGNQAQIHRFCSALGARFLRLCSYQSWGSAANAQLNRSQGTDGKQTEGFNIHSTRCHSNNPKQHLNGGGRPLLLTSGHVQFMSPQQFMHMPCSRTKAEFCGYNSRHLLVISHKWSDLVFADLIKERKKRKKNTGWGFNMLIL